MKSAARTAVHGLESDPDSGVEPFLLINRQRRHRIDCGGLVEFLDRIRRHLGVSDPFSVVVVRDSVIRRYSRDFRGQDKSTDVLSFPASEGCLGDILISIDTAWRQAARTKNLTLDKNLRRLALHGLLHLMGHDHETDNGEMRAAELRLRRKFQC